MYDVLDGFEVFKTQCVFQQLLAKEKVERGSPGCELVPGGQWADGLIVTT